MNARAVAWAELILDNGLRQIPQSVIRKATRFSYAHTPRYLPDSYSLIDSSRTLCAMNQLDTVFYKSCTNMCEIESNSVELIITSPPYFNIKDYAKDGFQQENHSVTMPNDLGALGSYEQYIAQLGIVWQECYRILKPNGKLCINVPLLPMLKRDMDTHYTRHIFDLQSAIQQWILSNTSFYLFDIYIWNRTNPSKRLMFGSYPYPRNFYAQNTSEFITVYVKDGKPETYSRSNKEESKLSENEWITFTKQIWDIPIPGRGDLAFGKHSAIMPEQIPYRLIRLYSMVGDTIVDPFTGSGTTLRMAHQLNRHFIGYELYEHYKSIIQQKIYGDDTLFH